MTIEGVRAEVIHARAKHLTVVHGVGVAEVIHARAKHLTIVHGVDDVVGVAAGVDER